MNNGTCEGEAIAVTDRIHHAEIHIGHMAQGAGFAGERKQVAGVGISVEVAKFEQLLQPGDHASADQGRGVQVASLQRLAFLQLGAIDPLGGEHPLAG